MNVLTTCQQALSYLNHAIAFVKNSCLLHDLRRYTHTTSVVLGFQKLPAIEDVEVWSVWHLRLESRRIIFKYFTSRMYVLESTTIFLPLSFTTIIWLSTWGTSFAPVGSWTCYSWIPVTRSHDCWSLPVDIYIRACIRHPSRSSLLRTNSLFFWEA